MSLYRKKPVVIEARRLPERLPVDKPGVDELIAISAWCGGYIPGDGGLLIGTLEGEMRANPGDWIIKGVKGEFYPCKPDIFDATYEPEDARERPASISADSLPETSAEREVAEWQGRAHGEQEWYRIDEDMAAAFQVRPDVRQVRALAVVEPCPAARNAKGKEG